MKINPGDFTAPLPGYEITFVTKTEMTDTALSQLREKLTAAINRFKGAVVVHEDWGRRKLAYPIKKETRGHYTYFAFTGEGPVVAEVERNLRLNENTLRFMTINLADEFDAGEFRKTFIPFLKRDKRDEEARPTYSPRRERPEGSAPREGGDNG